MSQRLPPDISVQDVTQLLDAEAPILLLDCRTPDEYELVHLDQGVLIPMDQLQQRIDDLEKYKESRVVVYCHLGGRSQMVVDWLRQQGFEGAQNMVGGIDRWAIEIDQALRRY